MGAQAMTDPPKPPRPRPEAFPPPLPGAYTEPFPPARDPEFRMRSTPPSGSLLLNKEVEQLNREDPRDDTIREMRAVNVILREKLAAMAVAPSPVPVSAPPLSKRQAAGQAVVALGKWSTIVMGVLGLAATVAHQFRPDLEGPIQFLIKLLGGTP
jgi:hypothetical protein